MFFDTLLAIQIGGNTGKDIVVFLGIFVLSLIVLKIFKQYVLKYIKNISTKSKIRIDDAILDFLDNVGWPFFIYVSLYISSRWLSLSYGIKKVLWYILVIQVVWYAIKCVSKIIDFVAKGYMNKKREQDTSMIKVLSSIVKTVVWIIAFLLILSNLGFDITSLVAGLGVGGIAIAFALQNILSDLFSSFSIYFDKPFKEGDYITIGTDSGTVKHIGLKTTRIQTLQGQELIISNNEMTTARIHNYKRMERRRVTFMIGVEYGTSMAKMRKINGIVKEIFAKEKIADLDRVHFKEFGPFSLNVEVVYFVNSKEYIDYLDLQERVNLKIKEAFEKEKIEMAFPTQTLYVKK